MNGWTLAVYFVVVQIAGLAAAGGYLPLSVAAAVLIIPGVLVVLAELGSLEAEGRER